MILNCPVKCWTPVIVCGLMLTPVTAALWRLRSAKLKWSIKNGEKKPREGKR